MTKYRPPLAVGSLVDRQRLLDQLTGGRNCRLALIHAPAGFGKTTLAAQWRRQLTGEGRAVAWMSIDHDDNNAVWFLAHLIEAVRWVRPSLGAELLGVLEEHADEADRYVLTALVNEIDSSGEPLVLVVDDWHRVGDPRAIAAMEFILDSASPLLQIVVASRTRSGLPLGRLRVRNQLVEVDASALRFDAAESEQLLVEINGLPLVAGDIEGLLETTDGWVAALQLASLSMRGQPDPAQLIKSLSGRHQSIGEYLAENVLDRLPPDTLEFLLRTSLPERLCADLATALTGSTRSQAMLEEVETGDLFLRPLDEDRTWFRYHHLFAEFLRRRLEREHPDEVRNLHRTAAFWFASNNLSSEAVDHALAAEDPDLAVDIVTDQSMYLVEHSRMATLLVLVDKLPWILVADRPKLQMALAWANCLLQRRTEAQRALEELARSLRLGHDADEAADLLLEGRVVQACIDIYQDRIDRVEDLLGDCLDRSDSLRPWVIAVASNIETFANIHRFQFHQARSRQVWAWRFHQRTRGPFAGVYGQCFAGLAALEQLDVDAAQKHLAIALERGVSNAGRHSHAARLAGALLGALMYQLGDLDAAEQYLDEAHELGGESGVVDFMLASYVILARVKVARGDAGSAAELLDEGAMVARELGLSRLAAAIAEEQARQGLAGTTDEAPPGRTDEHLAQTRDGIAVAIADSTDAARIRRYRLAPGSADAAAAEARTLLERVKGQHRPLAELHARILLVSVLQRTGRSQDAIRELVPALQICARTGLVSPISDGGAPVAAALLALTQVASSQPRAQIVDGVPDEFLNKVFSATMRSEPSVPQILTEPGIVRATGVPGPWARRSEQPPITERELEILGLLDQGRSNKEIARRLNLSTNTVKWYLKALYAKFDVTRRQECVVAARSQHLFD